ncbi:MAG: zf-HC2 domain-containing protein [Muribaculaceae bacterium]|nr:zf-HC2 domain-containing protein [Muribaculaceae bacterium]
MNKNLTCNQVSALINFYIEGKLNPRLKDYVDLHLEFCPACRKKIAELRKILNIYKCENSSRPSTIEEKLHPEFIGNLSAYVDNELETDENIKIKKITISNPAAREKLETMYKFKKLIHGAYEKTKNDSKFDYSKNIINKLQTKNEYTTTYFYKLIGIFILLVCGIICGFIYLYF